LSGPPQAAAGRTILDALLEAGVGVHYGCMQGATLTLDI
jgi:ferredoxin